jgi:transcriptional regulator with XRE-family HTH domain
MTDAPSRRPNPWPPVVQTVLEDARRSAGSGAALGAGLEDEGVGTEGGRYSESAISNWIKGRTMPPADVLLAAAKLAGISLDERITGKPAEAGNTAELEAQIHELRRELDHLRADLIDLYGRMGFPMPEHPEAEAPAERRRAVG